VVKSQACDHIPKLDIYYAPLNMVRFFILSRKTHPNLCQFIRIAFFTVQAVRQRRLHFLLGEVNRSYIVAASYATPTPRLSTCRPGPAVAQIKPACPSANTLRVGPKYDLPVVIVIPLPQIPFPAACVSADCTLTIARGDTSQPSLRTCHSFTASSATLRSSLYILPACSALDSILMRTRYQQE
jgi:hypothetical protein